MLPLAEARKIICSHVTQIGRSSTSLEKSLGRILLEPVFAPEDIPAFERSAMDGYAVNDSANAVSFRLVGHVHTGSAPDFQLAPGECARIFTGAQTPKGTSRILLQENTRKVGEMIQSLKEDTKTWIRHQGEDAQRGAILLEKGTLLGPGELSILAGAGVTLPSVSNRPRAIHFTTGDELVPPNSIPPPGQIRDTNSTLVSALLQQSGVTLVHQQHVQDSLESLVTPITQRDDETWDLLLISGGASVGDFDFGARALEQLGFTIHFRKLNLRPGKPLIFATRGTKIAFVIPGNPVSHFVTFHVVIQHAIDCLVGNISSRPLVFLPLTSGLSPQPDSRETWWPSRISVDQGQLKVTPIAWQSSGDIRGLLGATALLRIPSDTIPPGSGDLVECLLLEMTTNPFHS